jgi:hypothetical protein
MPLAERYRLVFLSDLIDPSEPKIPDEWVGMVEQLVCSQADVFVGTLLSTFSAMIHRLRGYMSHRMALSASAARAVSMGLGPDDAAAAAQAHQVSAAGGSHADGAPPPRINSAVFFTSGTLFHWGMKNEEMRPYTELKCGCSRSHRASRSALARLFALRLRPPRLALNSALCCVPLHAAAAPAECVCFHCLLAYRYDTDEAGDTARSFAGTIETGMPVWGRDYSQTWTDADYS